MSQQPEQGALDATQQMQSSMYDATKAAGNLTVSDMVSAPFKFLNKMFDGGVNAFNRVKGTDVSPLLAPTSALFGFYVAINGGKITKSMGCQVQSMLDESVLATQILTFLTIVFFSSLVTAAPNTMEEFISQLGQSVGLYIIYVLTTKLAKESFVLLVAIISIVFLLRKVANTDEIRKDSDKTTLIKNTSTGLLIFGMFVVIFGVASYTGQKLIEYKDNKGTWSWTNYVFGKPRCSNDGTDVTYIDGLKRLNPLRK